MYGLNSKDSLAKRQSRWVRDVDESLNFFTKEKQEKNLKNHSPEDSIIKLMNNVDKSDKSTILELKKDHEKLKRKIKNIQLNSDLTSRIEKLEKYRDISTLFVTLAEHDKELRNLKNTISELSSELSSSRSEKVKNVFLNNDNDDSMFSELTDNEIKDTHTFVPFFIKEIYTSRDNITILEKNFMDLTVQIIGKFSGAPIIFPFGKDKNLPFFKVKSLEMNFKDSKSLEGVSFGTFLKNTKGIYIIHFTELYYNGISSNIDTINLPLTIKCQANLDLE